LRRTEDAAGVLAMLGSRSFVTGLIVVCCTTAGSLVMSAQLAAAACGKECYVAPPPLGKEVNEGTESAPWPTISHALKNIAPGSPADPSRIIVNAGHYNAAVTIDQGYITLEGEIEAKSGARLATIDRSQPLGGWKAVVLPTGTHTGVYKIDVGNIQEVLVMDTAALSKSRIELRPDLQWKRVIRLNDASKGLPPYGGQHPDAMFDFDTNPSHIMRTNNAALWKGIEALWGRKGDSLYLRFIAGNPNLHEIKGGSGPVVVVTAPGVTVRNFNIRGGFTGVYVAGKSPFLENNLITGGTNQIRLGPGADGAVIRGNELTANLLGNKRNCTPGIDAECWTAGAWAHDVYTPQWPGGIIPEYITVRQQVHTATRGLGYQVLSAIGLNGAGPGTIIEGNELHDGIGGIDIGNSDKIVPIEIRHNTIRDMTHFGILMRPGVHARIHYNILSNITEPFRPHQMNSKNETAAREIFIYRNVSLLPLHAGLHIFFHWITCQDGSCPPPPHKLHFYQNTFLGGYVALWNNGYFDPKVGLVNSQFLDNVFSADRFLHVVQDKQGNFLQKKMIEKFSSNWISEQPSIKHSKEFPSPWVGAKDHPLWLDNTNIVSEDAVLPLVAR
jgi:hypothetical protein